MFKVFYLSSKEIYVWGWEFCCWVFIDWGEGYVLCIEFVYGSLWN